MTCTGSLAGFRRRRCPLGVRAASGAVPRYPAAHRRAAGRAGQRAPGTDYRACARGLRSTRMRVRRSSSPCAICLDDRLDPWIVGKTVFVITAGPSSTAAPANSVGAPSTPSPSVRAADDECLATRFIASASGDPRDIRWTVVGNRGRSEGVSLREMRRGWSCSRACRSVRCCARRSARISLCTSD